MEKRGAPFNGGRRSKGKFFLNNKRSADYRALFFALSPPPLSFFLRQTPNSKTSEALRACFFK
jgi:hypothetical protein